MEAVYRRRRRQGMTRAAEESAQMHSRELDGRALLWTFKSLNEDQELERFIAAIPSFCSSKAIEDPVSCLARLDDEGLSEALFSLMHRTLTSNLVSELVKQRRIRVCTKAIDAAPVLASWRTLSRVFGEWDGVLESIDFGRSLIRCVGTPYNDPRTDFWVRCIVAVIFVRSQQHGRSQQHAGCSDLPILLLGISDDLLFKYNLGGRNNVLLATLTFTTRLIVRFHSEHPWDALSNVPSRMLDELLFDIDMQRALPELQQEFCGLWNEVVHMAQDGAGVHVRSIPTEILRRLRKNYIAFHENTDPTIPTAFYEFTNDHDPILYHGSVYPLCNVQNHHPLLLHPAPHRPEMSTTVVVTQGTTVASSTPPATIHPVHPV